MITKDQGASDATPSLLSVRRSRSNPNMVRILVSGRLLAKMRAATAASLGLRSGLELTEEITRRIESELERDRLRRYALRLLAMRGRYARTLARRLEARGGTPAVTEQVIDDLTQDGWLNDARQAEHDARRLVERGSALTAQAIADRLTARGCDPHDARRAADAVADASSGRDAALAHARSRLARMQRLSPEARRRRLAADLARRGVEEDDLLWILSRLGLDELPGDSC